MYIYIYIALVAMAQLNVLVALTRDAGASWASQALRTPLAQWLGNLSMNVYLFHYPLIGYLAFLLHGGKPNTFECGPNDSEAVCYERYMQYEHNKVTPLWGVVAVPAAALLLAELVHRTVEAPARRCLRKEG